MLVVPKNVGFSIPGYEPETRTLDSLGTKCRPIDHPGHPQGSGREHHPPVTKDRDGPRRTPVSSGRRESLSRSETQLPNPCPKTTPFPNWYSLLIQLYCSTITYDDVIQSWVLRCSPLIRRVVGRDTQTISIRFRSRRECKCSSCHGTHFHAHL